MLINITVACSIFFANNNTETNGNVVVMVKKADHVNSVQIGQVRTSQCMNVDKCNDGLPHCFANNNTEANGNTVVGVKKRDSISKSRFGSHWCK